MSRFLSVFLGVILLLTGAGAAQDHQEVTDAPSDATSIRITSPLGRTGVVSRLRIVAQLHLPSKHSVSPVSFWVDGALVGTVESGPPYVVEWTDENPFERREISVEAVDDMGTTVHDSVILPPFEVTGRSEISSVLLETGVYDKAGRSVSQLDSSAFTILEDDVPQKVDLIERERLPSTLLLLVDNSQSMSRRMDFVQAAVARLAATLRQHDRVIVAPFNTHVGIITGPTNDAPTIAEAVSAMHAGGGTALLDGVVEGVRLLDGLEGRRAIVLVTDGYDENSAATVEQALNAAEGGQVTIYGLGIGGVAGISLKGEDLLRHLADQTGGRVFFPPRETDLANIADSVTTDAHSRYLIAYTPENQHKDGTWRKVSVEVPNGYRVRTRAGYFAPSPPPVRPILEIAVKNSFNDTVNVSADELEVLEDGVTQKLETFQEAVDPVSIVMALDSSGSMVKSADLVRQTARDFVVAVRPEDSLALITFADKPLFAHVLATNREWTLDAIDKYTPKGGTALYDAVWNSFMHLKGVRGRHAILLLTDGRDEDNPGTGPGSVHTLQEVLNLGREVDAMVFSVGLGTKIDRNVIETLAKASGGQAYLAADASRLGEQFQRIIEDLRRRYVVGYTSTNFKHDGKWRTVEIRSRTDGLTITSRGGYFAPGE